MSASGASRGSTAKFIAGVVAVLVLSLGGFTLYQVYPTASNQGYAPEQPIPYSHKLHAGQLKIDCQYCHVGAERAASAMIPSVETCMNCHRVVKTDSPLIQKIHKAYNEGKPIEWVRVHELPDHARFPHNRHIAKGVKCETCHGPIQEMERVYQFSPLTMGWCLGCHRNQSTPKYLKEAIYPNQPDATGQIAPFECSTCHY